MQIVKGSEEKLSQEIISLLKEKIKQLSSSQERVIFGIVGGASVKKILIKLSEEDINWDKVHFFRIDERFVDINSEESNHKIAKEIFFDKIKIKEENIHAFDYSIENPVENYTKEFLNFGEVLDIALVSVAEDGHIASLFPNFESTKDDSNYFIKVKNSPKPPPIRISASRKMLSNSQTGIFLFMGGKEKAYCGFLEDNLTVLQCPSKIAKNMADSYVFKEE